MDWIQVISNIGVPTTAFLLSGWFIRYMYDKSSTQVENSIKSVSELAAAVNHNTEVLTELVNEIKDVKED